MKQSIGVFDSGVGGLSVWKEMVKILPNEDILYFADSANCPYGPKSKDEVVALADKIVNFFVEKDVKLVVVACNTATAAAIDFLRAKYTIPFVGMEPAVKPAAMNTETGCIGILATSGTLQGRLFNETKGRYASDVTVINQIGTGLVELVESGKQHSKEARILLEKYVRPMVAKGADHIVLGCTHYPFFRPLIDEIAGVGVQIVDPAPAVARRALEVLQEEHLQSDTTSAVTHKFYTSGTSETLELLLEKSLNINISEVTICGNVML